MRRRKNPYARKAQLSLKRFMPTSLFARALLILLLPILLMQGLVTYFFFERHWDSIVRNMSSALAGEVAVIMNAYHGGENRFAMKEAQNMATAMGMRMSVVSQEKEQFRAGYNDRAYRIFYRDLKQRSPYKLSVFTVNKGADVLIRIQLDNDHILKLQTTRKRLASNTTGVFIVWMAGSALLLMLVAIVFLRNQVKPIIRLARAAEQLGLGQDVTEFRPSGAAEVRQAGRAFLIMRDRLRKQITTRTEMLAGISHDLRTPLTRMQLQIAMAPLHEAQKKIFAEDIDDMRHMITEYLDFARGDAAESSELVEITALVRDVVESYTRVEKPVYLQLQPPEAIMLQLRPQAIKRCMTNLIDNALRYGARAVVSIESSVTFVRIKIEDAGAGILEQDQEEVFKPFTRLETSRNSKTGGVGLGLSIARDIAQSHGGDIVLENLRDAESIRGLLVTLRLPREMR